jgi:type II secretory pathway predicted ATPase ExeA
VLVGLPELRDTLQRPGLRALAQRLTARAELTPLGLPESADYIVHQLRFAGARPEAVIADEALEIIAKSSRGVPRLLNQAAHQALALTCQVGAGRVDAEAALEALARLGLEAPADDEPAAEPESEQYLLQPPGMPPRLVYAPGRSG